MNWTVHVAKAAGKQLAKFPAKDQTRIQAALDSMAGGPFSGDVLKLEGEGERWRRRVGNYRIFFTVNVVPRIVAVSGIVRRTSTTY